MTPAQVVPALIIPFIAWRVYVRARRSIGRQPYHPKHLVVRAVFFSVVSLGVAAASWTFPPALAALGGGLLLGLPLAFIGLHLTRFESSPQGKFYVPNTAIGIGLTVLLAGRMAYRILVFSFDLPTDRVPAAPFQSPLTQFVFGLTAGYYIAYYAGVLVRGK